MIRLELAAARTTGYSCEMAHASVIYNDSGAVELLASRLEKWATALSLGRPIQVYDDTGAIFEVETVWGPETQEPLLTGVILNAPTKEPSLIASRLYEVSERIVGETFAALMRIVPNKVG